MTPNFFLNWATLAVSLINVILLLWLGLTVLLNAEARSRGVWLASSGLLLGAGFFISHSAILGYGLDYESYGINLWWRLGWLPLLIIPFVWYMVMLWYTGCWPDQARFPQRQRYWAGLMGSSCLGLILWLLVAPPLPSFSQTIWLDLSTVPMVGGWPVFLLVYPLYIFGCISPALYLLWQTPLPTQLKGALGRQHARPWLIATSVVLLLISLAVVGATTWLLRSSQGPVSFQRSSSLGDLVAGFDLLIAGLIAAATILIGQAIVSFEVFTEKALPRSEFQRQWRNAVILALGYSLVVGWGLALQIRPIYLLLLTTLLMTLFFALSGWRAYTWRARYLRQLRPFMASQRLYEHLLAAVPAEVDVEVPFEALCREVLRAESACLAPLGPLAPLVQPLNFPRQMVTPPPLPADLKTLFHSPEEICLPLEPSQGGSARWAVPLWSERGLIGVFLLGPKRDGGLYTEEEIELARLSGERLIDTRASAEISRRLMQLQRQRLVESQLLDRQTRRVLHDDILPDLHTALLLLGGAEANPEAVKLLAGAHRQISNLLRDMPLAPAPHLERAGLVGALERVIADEVAHAFDRVTWQLQPEATQAAGRLPSLMQQILFYAAREAIRNAAKHARCEQEARPLALTISLTQTPSLTLCIEDNGAGITAANPHPNGGSGQGLALHSTMLAVIGGTLNVDSLPGVYTRVTMNCGTLENINDPLTKTQT